jgi:hypothetical protein
MTLLLVGHAMVLEQPPRKIRIIHRGEEIKPIGTVWITEGKCSSPIDREFDHIFGRCVEASDNDLKVITNVFRSSKNIKKDSSELMGSASYYEIIIERSSHHLFLTDSSYKSFVKEWRDKLAEKKIAERLINLFQ